MEKIDDMRWTLSPARKLDPSDPGWKVREVPGGAIYYLPASGIGVFVPTPVEGADAPLHVCDHGFAATSCGICNHGATFGSGR